MRLVLAVIGRRLVVSRRLVVGLIVGLRALVVSNRRSAHRSRNQCPPPYPSSETHGELHPVRPADLRLPGQYASLVASPV